ncbi:Protein SPIRAL1-like 3 [Hirschfeldia incana]|nr:Protein SPIRAL1-like 3 [Hirschfeldia incana]
MGKARGVNSGVHQSSLGYLFGSSGDSPSSAATKMGTTTTTTTTTKTDGTGRRPITTTTTTVTDNNNNNNNNRLAAGDRGSPNNYFRSEGQNSGNFLTERPSTKVRSAPGGVSSLGYLFGGPNAADSVKK